MENEYESKSCFEVFYNYLVILICMTFFTILITAVNLSDSFTQFESIVLLIFAVIFLGYSLEKSWNSETSTNLWNKIVGNELIAGFLGIIPWILIYVWAFALVRTPNIYWTWLLSISIWMLVLPFILNGCIELNKILNDIAKTKQSKRRKEAEKFFAKIIKQELKK